MTRWFPRFRPEGGPKNQIQKMKELFPGFTCSIDRGGVVWTGILQPTRESPQYRIRIDHRRDRAPRVFVTDPRPRPGAPHRYPEDGSLCLYWPKDWRWSGRRSLAETLVPWAAFWLYYYEIWQACGEWLGPEAPHGEEKRPQG